MVWGYIPAADSWWWSSNPEGRGYLCVLDADLGRAGSATTYAGKFHLVAVLLSVHDQLGDKPTFAVFELFVIIRHEMLITGSKSLGLSLTAHHVMSSDAIVPRRQALWGTARAIAAGTNRPTYLSTSNWKHYHYTNWAETLQCWNFI